MPPTPVHLTTGTSTENVGVYTTESVSPTSGRPVFLAVLVTGTSPVPKATVTGAGLSWSEIATTTVGARVLQIFQGTGTPTPGTLTITAIGGGTPWTSAVWQAVEWTGADAANPVVQSMNARPAAAEAVNEPFPSAVTAGNTTWGVVSVAVAAIPIAGSGWTALGSTTQSAPATGFLGEASTSAPQQNVAATWTGSSASFVVGLEIRAAAAGPANLDDLRLGAGTVGLRYGAAAISKAYLGATQIWP